MKKILALVLALAMVALCGLALADDGTLTISNATAGQTYKAYKVFNAVYSGDAADATSPITGVNYTVPSSQEALLEGSPFEISTAVASNGEHIINKKANATDAQIIDWMKANYSKFDATGTELTYDDAGIATGTLPFGYYYITSSLGTVISIDTLNNAVSVVDKNTSTPEEPDKDITDEDSAIAEGQDQSDVELDSNDASVDTVETFQVDFNAVNWVKAAEGDTAFTKVTEYNFIDTPTNLAINADSVHVYVNWGETTQQEVTSTITGKEINPANGALTFTIPWVDGDDFRYAATTDNAGLIPVHVTYTATVLASAAVATAPNTVEVLYNNNPDNSLGTSSTTTYTYKFKLLKTDGTDALLGAEFELYYGTTASESAPALTFTYADGVYTYDAEGTITHIAPAGDDASAIIKGLDNASYMLREVKVPGGYNKADDQAVTGLSRVDTEDTAITTITVINQTGTELPSTGGIGTTIFYILGGLLVVGAAVILVARRKAQD